MKALDVIAQGLSILGMAMNVLSFQNKKKNGILLFQLFGALFFSASYFLLGAYVGGFLNFIAMVRAIVYLKQKIFHSEHIAWLIGFTVTYVLSYLATFTILGKEVTAVNLLVESLPVIGMILTTISFRMTEAKAIRRIGLINSPAWLIYNVIAKSLGASLCEIFSLISILVAMIRLDRNGTKTEINR